MSDDWKTRTWALFDLRDRATHYDELWIEGGTPFALDFLYWAGVIPKDVNWKRKNSVPKKFLDGGAIPAGYLAEVAASWDEDGWSSAESFCDMLAFEVTGTPQSNVLLETMSELGR
jgi:hypothetical protein